MDQSFSLTACFHVVRACEHDGHPAELRDPGDVPALREHRLLLRPLPDITGTQTRTSFSQKLCLELVCIHLNDQ